MRAGPPRILIAAQGPVIRELRRIFRADDVETVGAETWEQAASRLEDAQPDLILVCYAFDEGRPFRLLHHVREDRRRAHVPTILVRTLPLPLGKTQEAQIREAYKTLGVDEFFNLHDASVRDGAEAAAYQFRDAVLGRLSVRLA